jgi:peptidyl-tRNA hydrolase, PTH2 family
MIEDPLALYIIVRESLGMSAGKMCAQVGHSVQYTVMNYLNNFYEDKLGVFANWIDNGSRKIVLKASESEWKKLKEQLVKYSIVRDNGLTELDPGTETVIAAAIMKKSEAPKIIKRLQVLT